MHGKFLIQMFFLIDLLSLTHKKNPSGIQTGDLVNVLSHRVIIYFVSHKNV